MYTAPRRILLLHFSTPSSTAPAAPTTSRRPATRECWLGTWRRRKQRDLGFRGLTCTETEPGAVDVKKTSGRDGEEDGDGDGDGEDREEEGQRRATERRGRGLGFGDGVGSDTATPECRIRRWRARRSARFGGGGGGEGRRLGFAERPSSCDCGCEGRGSDRMGLGFAGGRGLRAALIYATGRAMPLPFSRTVPCRPACRGKGPSTACYGPQAGTGTFSFRAVPCSGRASKSCFGPCLRPVGCMLRFKGT